jgi:glycosyltransferase involved in cell wall biosynthesis
LEHSAQIFAKAGWKALFLGVGGAGAGASALPFIQDERIEVRMRSLSQPGWRQKLHYLRYLCWVVYWSWHFQPDFVYASDCLSAPAALLLTRIFGFEVIYHEHDVPQASQTGAFQKICLSTRQQLASCAKLCILPNQKRLETFRRETGAKSKLLCVWNCPSVTEVSNFPKVGSKKKLTAYYHGNLSERLLPTTILEAMALLAGKIELKVIGYETAGQQGYINKLKGLAAKLRIEDCLQFLAPMPRHQLWPYLSACDIGLALINADPEDQNLRTLIGASNKPFDYLAGGLALLTSDLPEWRTMYVDAGYGLACDPGDANSIANALRWFCENPGEMLAMGERGQRKIFEDWNYESQFASVMLAIGEGR